MGKILGIISSSLIISMEYISLCMYTVMQKNCGFIGILSELHAPWQPVMQCYVIGLTTLNHR